MKIPSNNTWTQTNEGDISGILHSTRNISLNTPGKAQLSQKSICIMTADYPTANDLERVVSIVYYDDTYIAVHTAGVRTFDLEGAAIGSTGVDPTPSIYGDGILFNNLLLVSTNNSLSSYDGSTWTNSLDSTTGSVPHPMAIFDSLTTYKLSLANNNTVKQLDTSYNESTAVLTLPNQYIVTSLAYSNGYLYVGTRNKYGGDTKIFIWDGNGNNANYEVPVSGNWVYSVKPYQSSVCAILSSGELIYINGTTAQRLGALPVFFNPTVNWQGTLDSDVPRVFHRGMETDGDLIYLNVNALVETAGSRDYLPGFESGLWVFDPQNGLYHRASTVYEDTYVIDSALSVSNSIITTASAHKLKTGDSVVFSSVSGLTGVDTTMVYYVTVLSTTTLKLSTSRRGVLNSEYVTIGGAAGSSDKLVYTPNTEYFQYARVSSGAIAKPTAHDGYFKNWSTPIIWASSAQDKDIAQTKYAINILGDSYNIGVLETQRIYSGNIEQSWKSLVAFIDGLNLDNEEVIIKYRTQDELGYPTQAVLGYWVDDSTINFDREDCAYIEVGDEMMIVDGYGRGYSAHVTAVDNSTSVTSVTVDESLGTANKPARISFTNYRKVTTHTADSKIKDYLTSNIGQQSSWIQLKAELRGFSTAVNMFDLSNEVQKKSQ